MPRTFTTLLLACCFSLPLGAGLARAQVFASTDELAFDRTESWAMKYYASLALFTGMGVPDRMGAGAIDVGFEASYVPQLTEDQRRVGFEGTKVEDLNRTHFFGRIRGTIGLSENYSLFLAYLPPIDIGGIKPNLFAAGIGRPFRVTDSFRVGVRGFGQLGTITGDITCSADEIANGPNPFQCESPSNDRLDQRLLGLELTGGYVTGSPFRPYFGVSFNYLDLKFHVDAAYAGIVDQTLQTTHGGTVSLTGGLTYVANEKWRFTGEMFYSWLSVVRPPSTSSVNDGLLNARFLVTYRIH
jgi:hypothetical protein